MTAKKMLCEILNDLTPEELDKFKSLIELEKDIPPISRSRLKAANTQDTVELMMETYSEECVELTKKILKKMNRTDLVQRLSDTGSGSKEKQRPSLIQRVETMTAKKMLREILNNLSPEELDKFKSLIELEKDIPPISRSRLKAANTQDTVELMVEMYSEECVELTKKILKKMNRTDLVQRLSDTGSGSKDYNPTVTLFSPKAALMKFGFSVKRNCVVLIYKSNRPFLTFHVYLIPRDPALQQEVDKRELSCGFTKILKPHPEKPLKMRDRFILTADVDGAKIFPETLELRYDSTDPNFYEVVVKNPDKDFKLMLTPENGHQPVWTCKIRKGDYQRSTGPLQVKYQSEPLHKEVTPLMKKLLETLKDLSYGELEQFKHVLQRTIMKKDLPKISSQRMEMAERDEIAELMVEIYGEQSVEVTREVLMEMNRDLAERLLEISLGSKGPSGSSEHEGCGSVTQDSSDWTKLDPEVNCTDADEAPTYSLQSGAGNFECSVSGMRWVCKEKVSFKYQFCSLSGHLERIESMKYMPAGPLMDITVIAGKLDVVYLPHWICIDDNPKILDKFAVLHIDDCGDAVEKVSEVTSSHVKLSKPVFSLKMVLVKLGLPVEIYCRVLIYSKVLTASSQTSLTLHVYLIPPDQDLIQELDKTEISDRYKGIRKSNPAKPLKMHDWFILTTDLDGAEIYPKGEEPQTLELRYDSTDPNFYEVVVKNPDKKPDFKLMLTPKNGHQPVWTCEIRKDDYQRSTGPLQVKYQSEPLHKEVTPLMKKFLETLKDLSYGELKQFKHVLQRTRMTKGLPKISSQRMEMAERDEIAELMVEIYGEQSVEVTREVLMEMNMTDLAERLLEISLGSKGPSGSSEHEGCGSVTQDSSDWTKLDPEVNCADADEAPTYSLQSGAGNFECSVSGLRWVCKEKVNFKYQFCSLSGHLERIESMEYMPAGPLMDITVIAGKLDVVYLPHWICIDDNPKILDKFAVLHIDDCGDAVEKVSEVTSSHVKLSEPVFSLKMVLVKLGLPVEICCRVLIYSKVLTASSQTSLTLHVYLIPPDQDLIQELDKTETSDRYKGIRKSNPAKPLKMHDWFILTTDLDGADIYPKGEEPQTLKLRYNSTDPNFYEVVVKNPDKDFKLMLTPKNGHQPVWTSEILKGEWQSTGHIQVTETAGQSSMPGPSYKKHSVDKHQEAAITVAGEKLLNMLKELKSEEFKEFKWRLPRITESQRENTDRVDLVNLMLQTYTQESVEVAKDILKKIPRNDLVQLLSDTSSGSEAAGSSA
ncbi:uncharacterized protein LOC125893023 isoform X15 [Epinephelus fuscoguttatus]|uniref:uncharacterized protein LOC125893023 isoform X14 n=2 Tax=Epinephelus fuscoguttatus TaxID=293821 RepID=UPI0020D09427|nr:uncharacterized protein LOC125893023 isoform X14 [Epinephelus fuscoguttatus]XP_049439401.1 uncharacterized protein LOC125893023 isoform X15 [Epinephelus fuscoguttatus]